MHFIDEAYTYYLFGEKFGFTPQQVRDMDMDDYHMLKYAIDKVAEEQEKAHNKANRNQGGSQANGQSKTISSTNDLVMYAQSRRDCKVEKKDG